MNKYELKALRKLKGLTVKDIAEIVCRNPSTIAQWESGRVKIDKGLWKLLLLSLDITEEEVQKALENNTPKSQTSDSTSLPMSFKAFKAKLHELQDSTHKEEQKKVSEKDLTFIDLFCGIGGIRKGFEENGCKCIFSSDIDIPSNYTYFFNYGVVPYGDITKIEAKEIPSHNILCAGFPCQPFSHIGKREGFRHPTQGTMFYEIVRVLKEKKPLCVFLENVPGLLNHDNGRTLQTILDSLKELGYFVKYTTLNAKDFGVPQNRERFYLVGFTKEKICEKFHFPRPPMINADIGNYVETNIDGYEISEHLQKVYLFKKDDGRPMLIDKNSKGPIKTLVCSYHKIQRLTGTFVRDGKTGIRLLTCNECKAIMGFPQSFIFPVSRTQMYRQLGNSVVVSVITSIAKEIVRVLKTTKA